MPTTAAFVPASARRNPTDPRSQSQNGKRPEDQQERRQEDADERDRRAWDAVRVRRRDGPEVGREREQRAGHGLCRAVPREELVVGHPAGLDDRRMEQRQDDVAAPEHERARDRKNASNRATGWPSAARSSGRPSSRPANSASADDPDPTRDRARFRARSGIDGRRRQQRSGRSRAPAAMIATWANGVVQASATAGRGRGPRARRGQSGVRLPAIAQTAWATTATAASLEAVDPAGVRQVGRGRHEAEGREGHGRRQGEPDPRGQPAEDPGAAGADRDPELAACRARQELAQRHEVAERRRHRASRGGSTYSRRK